MEFQIGDVAKILFISRDRLSEWVKRGFVSASEQRPYGAREINIFNFADLLSIQIFDSMLKWGFARNHARYLVKVLKSCQADLLDEQVDFIVFYRWPMDMSNEYRKKYKLHLPEIRFVREEKLSSLKFETVFVKFDDVKNPIGFSEVCISNAFVFNLQYERTRTLEFCNAYIKNPW